MIQETFHAVDDQVQSVLNEVIDILKVEGIKYNVRVQRDRLLSIEVPEIGLLVHRTVGVLRILLKDYPVKIVGDTNSEVVDILSLDRA